MIKPYYSILGRTVPSYGIFICIGILLATLVASTICKRKGTERYEIVYSGIYTGIGGFLGAKLLFILVSLPQIIANHIPFWAVMMGGFVFYGGLIGGALGMYIYCKQFKVDMGELVETYAAALPLAHAFGRVGCFFAGCCYGVEYNGVFSYTYTATLGVTPIGVPLLPIQLIEALGLVIIFAIELLVYIKTKKKRGYSLVIYMISYSILRFVLEFFRGDSERGKILFSTSQWISIIMFICAAVIVIAKFKNHKHEKDCYYKRNIVSRGINSFADGTVDKKSKELKF